MHYRSIRTLDLESNVWQESSENWRNAPEIAILTKKSKIFIKAKLTVSKSYLLGLVYFMISCILRGALILINFFQERGALSNFDYPLFPYTFGHSFMPPFVFGEAQFLSQFNF